jgi:hypothetical protein
MGSKVRVRKWKDGPYLICNVKFKGLCIAPLKNWLELSLSREYYYYVPSC